MSATCNMLWIGPRLGPIERACMRSVVRQGHPLVLWVYQRPDGVPDGVVLRDARAVLPEEAILRHSSGSVSLFSNWFRYRLQELGHGVWLDSDIYLLRPFECGDYLLTCHAPGRVNSAPLRMPPDSPLLPPLLALFEQKTVPRWTSRRARIAAYWRLWRTGSVDLARMPWGVAGPLAVTATVRAHGMMGLASPAETFHPFDWTEADWIADPARVLEERATERTRGVHLWNERIKGFKEKPAPAGSFLARLQAEGA